jgi:phage-related protein (TIGR01555 family)
MTTAKPTVRVPAGSTRLGDGLTNVITMAGTSADRTTHNRYGMGFVDRYQVEASYRTSGLSRKIHDIPPYEMTREGRDWQADDKSIEKLESLERKLGLWAKIRAAMTAARLYGGSLLVLGLTGDPEQPAPRPGSDSLKYVSVLSRYQVSVGPLDTNLRSPFFGQPTYYEMNSGSASVKIHPSRVIAIVGQPVPVGSIGFGDNQGFWGDPLLLSIEQACKNVDASHQNIAALLSEAKVDTITMSRLSDNLGTTEGENLLAQRIRVAQLFQSMFNTRLLDGGSGPDTADKWETRQLSFAGLPEVVRAFQVYVAGVADIPYSRLFGESPGGLNATGNSEQTDFNKMIRSKQNTELRPVLDRIDEYLIPSALGSRPSDIYWTFAPLEEVNPETASKIEKSDAETVKIYADAGLVPQDVLAAMARGRLMEGGYWPGVEAAYDESDAAGEVDDVPEGEDPAAEEISLQEPLRLAANDKLTDPQIDEVVDAVTEGDEKMADRVKRLIAWAMGRA